MLSDNTADFMLKCVTDIIVLGLFTTFCIVVPLGLLSGIIMFFKKDSK